MADQLPTVLSDTQSEKKAEALADAMPGLVASILGKWQSAKDKRYNDETRWLSAYNDFRGKFDASKRLRDSEKSKVFVKIPKTKTVAAYSQLMEIIFASGELPIEIMPTEKPQGIPEVAHADLNQQEAPEQEGSEMEGLGFPGDGKDADFSNQNPFSLVSTVAAKYGQKIAKMFSPGPALDKAKQIQINPAEMAAKEMNKTVHDQLTESDATTHISLAAFECCLLGHGIIKGPFNYYKTIHNWKTVDGKNVYSPDSKLIPKISHVSVFNFYPDPSADNMSEAEYVIERHKFNRSQMRDLVNLPHFNPFTVNLAISQGPNYIKQWWEDGIDDSSQKPIQEDRWEVFEYWGVVDRTALIDFGMKVPEDMDDLLEIQVNAWICGNNILRCVVNPFKPNKIPYYGVPYELNPYNFFGIGVPENMADSTMIMNGSVRMGIDNLALSGNVILEIDENSLVAGQPMELYPGKIFRRQTGAQGNAITAVQIPNVTQQNMMLFDKFRQFADEETGIQSYSHGSTGIQSTGRTASGMSMLMGAAALSIKTVVKNFDEFLLKPLGEGMFHWNMQFNEDAKIHGDIEVKARGTSALMQKEVRSQRLTTMLQTVANPMLAPFVKIHKILEEIAFTLELKPDDIINNPEEAALYAKIMADSALGGGGLQTGGPPSAGTTGTGNGTIGTGKVPQPLESEFSGNEMGGPAPSGPKLS